MATKLYVGNLPFDTTENDLHDLFSAAGTVSETALMQDRMTGKSRGFAFVTMSSDDEAKKAADQFNGKPFEGRNLIVNEARPREDRGGGFGGGGSNSGGPRRAGAGGGGGGGNRRY